LKKRTSRKTALAVGIEMACTGKNPIPRWGGQEYSSGQEPEAKKGLESAEKSQKSGQRDVKNREF